MSNSERNFSFCCRVESDVVESSMSDDPPIIYSPSLHLPSYHHSGPLNSPQGGHCTYMDGEGAFTFIETGSSKFSGLLW